MWKVIRMRLNLRALIEHKPLPRPKSHGGRGGVHKGGNIWGTVTSGHWHKDNISEGETYHFLLWPSDMLQDHRGWCHCTEHDFLLMFYSKFGHISYCWLQSILCWNDLAGRPWPLSDSEGQSRSAKWSQLETGPRPSPFLGVAHTPFACQRWGLPHRLAQCATGPRPAFGKNFM